MAATKRKQFTCAWKRAKTRYFFAFPQTLRLTRPAEVAHPRTLAINLETSLSCSFRPSLLTIPVLGNVFDPYLRPKPHMNLSTLCNHHFILSSVFRHADVACFRADSETFPTLIYERSNARQRLSAGKDNFDSSRTMPQVESLTLDRSRKRTAGCTALLPSFAGRLKRILLAMGTSALALCLFDAFSMRAPDVM